MKHLVLIVLLFLAPFTTVQAEYQLGTMGMLSSRSDIASEVGLEILEQGGNAVDAAVATGFALAVAYPSAGNLGGGGFMIIRLANGDIYAQDSRERAPLAASRDMYLDAAGNVDRNLSLNSLQASGVPGSVAGLLDALEKFGTLSRQQVMAPAIRLASEGFILNDDLAGQFAGNLSRFQPYPASISKFSREGMPYHAGDRWIQPDLAKTLKLISDLGRDGFYKGETADLIVAEMERNGGLISHEDLENYEAVWREPIHGTYRGYDIWSMPAPSSGGILLVQMLNMLEPYNLGEYGWGSPATVHLMVEAQRRAYADRAEHLGDPDYFDVPVETLISKDYARQRFADFNPQMASDSASIGAGSWPEESPETTHFSIVDSQGNAVSMTTTLNSGYGNKIVVPGTGILMNNEMDDFSSKPGVPNAYGLIGREANAIEPGKRMLSSMTPTIVTRDGQPFLLTGANGGSTIINAALQVVINVIDHGLSIEDAVSLPRFHHQWMPDAIRYETGAIPDETVQALQEMEHKGLMESARPFAWNANSVLINGTALEGMSDPRGAGGTAGY